MTRLFVKTVLDFYRELALSWSSFGGHGGSMKNIESDLIALTAGFVALALLACSNEPGTSCERADRQGPYSWRSQLLSGNCSFSAGGYVTLLSGPRYNPMSGCTITSESWSAGECKLTREEECSFGARLVTVATTQPGNPDLDGVLTYSQGECSGTYSVTYERAY